MEKKRERETERDGEKERERDWEKIAETHTRMDRIIL